MSNLLTLGVLIASLSLTYFLCIKPMRKGGHCAMDGDTKNHAGTDDQDAAEILRLQQEIAQLREQATTGTTSTSRFPKV